MVTALASLLTGRPVRADVGMTGEVTLTRTGAADRRRQAEAAGRAPGRDYQRSSSRQRNQPDLDDVPAEVLEALTVKPMTDVAEIVAQALEPASEPATVAA